MPFPRALLLENEEIAVDMRPHWWMMVSSILFSVFILVFAMIVVNYAPERAGNFFRILMLAIVLISLVGLATSYLRWSNTNFVVTSERIVYRSGIIAKKAKEIPLDRVENLAFQQTIFERLIGSGDLKVESAGETGSETFHNMRRPNVLHNEIYRQIEALQVRDARRNAGFVQQGMVTQGGGQQNSNEGIPEQIHKLDQLRQRGLLSDAEFEEKKRELLDRM